LVIAMLNVPACALRVGVVCSASAYSSASSRIAMMVAARKLRASR